VPLACKEVEIVEQTYYRWRKEYGGLKVDQARRLRELAQENAKLKRLVSELSLRNLVLKGHRFGKLLSPERRCCAVSHACEAHGMSERHACRVSAARGNMDPRGHSPHTDRQSPTVSCQSFSD
jgi:putative transposase